MIRLLTTNVSVIPSMRTFPDTAEAQVLREEAEAPPVGTNN